MDRVIEKRKIPSLKHLEKQNTLKELIEKCLSFEKEDRPSLNYIIASFPAIILEYSVKEKSALEFWKYKFNRKRLPMENISFDIFKEELWSWFGLEHSNFGSEREIGLRALL